MWSGINNDAVLRGVRVIYKELVVLSGLNGLTVTMEAPENG